MKVCTRCKQEKPFDAFRFRKHRWSSWCKACAAALRMSIYYANPKAHRAYGKRRELVLRKVIDELRTPCIFCGESDKVCLDFHHRDPKAKEFNIAAGTEFSETRIRAEVAKCVSVCSNCHRKLHAGKLKLLDAVPDGKAVGLHPTID